MHCFTRSWEFTENSEHSQGESEPINIKLLVETSLFTGLRRGEIVGLKWEDIDLEKQTL